MRRRAAHISSSALLLEPESMSESAPRPRPAHGGGHDDMLECLRLPAGRDVKGERKVAATFALENQNF
jgi:hypothetical protein